MFTLGCKRPVFGRGRVPASVHCRSREAFPSSGSRFEADGVFPCSRPQVETLLKLFPTLEFRNVALQCLTEVGMLPVATVYDKHLVHMYTVFITQLQMVLPRGTNIPEAYANGSSDDQCFFQNLAMFLTGFFKMHIGLLDKAQENHQTMLIGCAFHPACARAVEHGDPR